MRSEPTVRLNQGGFKFESRYMRISIQGIALPPNKQLQLTVESVRPFAEQTSRHVRPRLS